MNGRAPPAGTRRTALTLPRAHAIRSSPLVPSGGLCQQTVHNRFQRRRASDRLDALTTLERKPALIEAIEHLYAWLRIPHALRTDSDSHSTRDTKCAPT